MASRDYINDEPNKKCPECKQQFSKEKIPKLLPCGHNVCVKCLSDIAGRMVKYACGICGEVHDKPPGGFPNIPANDTMIKISEGESKCFRCKQSTQLITCQGCQHSFCTRCNQTHREVQTVEKRRVLSEMEVVTKEASNLLWAQKDRCANLKMENEKETGKLREVMNGIKAELRQAEEECLHKIEEEFEKQTKVLSMHVHKTLQDEYHVMRRMNEAVHKASAPKSSPDDDPDKVMKMKLKQMKQYSQLVHLCKGRSFSGNDSSVKDALAGMVTRKSQVTPHDEQIRAWYSIERSKPRKLLNVHECLYQPLEGTPTEDCKFISLHISETNGDIIILCQKHVSIFDKNFAFVTRLEHHAERKNEHMKTMFPLLVFVDDNKKIFVVSYLAVTILEYSGRVVQTIEYQTECNDPEIKVVFDMRDKVIIITDLPMDVCYIACDFSGKKLLASKTEQMILEKSNDLVYVSVNALSSGQTLVKTNVRKSGKNKYVVYVGRRESPQLVNFVKPLQRRKDGTVLSYLELEGFKVLAMDRPEGGRLCVVDPYENMFAKVPVDIGELHCLSATYDGSILAYNSKTIQLHIW